MFSDTGVHPEGGISFSSFPLINMTKKAKVFLGQPLHYIRDGKPLVFNESCQTSVASSQVHDSHNKNEGNNDCTGDANGQWLKGSSFVTAGVVLPDNSFICLH